MNILSHSSVDRDPVAAGRFYSAKKEILENDLASLFSTCVKSASDLKVRAIISPHAGYVFSGKIAASAFSALQNSEDYKNIFIIGSSHIMSFEGASVYNTGDFITPLGKMKVNIEIANSLRNKCCHFNFPVTAHFQEHSIEVQIPFIQFYFMNEISIVPIIIGTDNKNTIKEIADALKPYFTADNLFLISSDFSHYPSYKDALKIDNITADAILSNNSEIFLKSLNMSSAKGISGLAATMCGWTSGLTLLYLSEGDRELQFRKISYCNSGDSKYGNKEEVVGYHAIELIENKKTIYTEADVNQEELKFTGEEAGKLISIARNSIRSLLLDNKKLILNPENMPSIFRRNIGAFVTLKISGNLRGCIGRFTSQDPLYQVVSEMAQSSAFEDSRFSPLSETEFEKTEIEISVLGPLKKISSIDEIIPGKHGIYIKKDFRSGTMLPQVAIENGWTVEQFLGYTSRDKAGLGWTGWKDAEINIYEAVVLKENK
ncbi:MAG: TIGR00296 family protein [Odoribacter sp.]|nr:TIGR00296 family protein [Odoribacter sp.]